ncbi:MAG: hypothetical protein BWY85_02340 [Firmicutes bacterium ADurb.Bin506]|nr:MAG: hypothetical protein BWY85_02340 [Firmicutes bacterium ADurb.Bin506]
MDAGSVMRSDALATRSILSSDVTRANSRVALSYSFMSDSSLACAADLLALAAMISARSAICTASTATTTRATRAHDAINLNGLTPLRRAAASPISVCTYAQSMLFIPHVA